MLNYQSDVIKHDRIVSTLVDGEIVMLDAENDSYLALNSVGTYIWEFLKETRKINEICDAVMNEFEVERERCEKEILGFIGKLYTENLVIVK